MKPVAVRRYEDLDHLGRGAILEQAAEWLPHQKARARERFVAFPALVRDRVTA